VGGPLDPPLGAGAARPPSAADGGPLGSAPADGAPDPLGPVFAGGSLAAPELAPGVDASGPPGAGMAPSLVPVLGVDAAALPPLSDVGPLEEGVSCVDDDEPESLGSSGDSADEPEPLEPPGDGSGSLGDIGAGPASSAGGMAAFAAPAPAHSSPTPRPLTNARRTTRCFVAKARLPVRPSKAGEYKPALSHTCAGAVNTMVGFSVAPSLKWVQ
jgi:hypothetical protein